VVSFTPRPLYPRGKEYNKIKKEIKKTFPNISVQAGIIHSFLFGKGIRKSSRNINHNLLTPDPTPI
jgi:hypothetical protein